MANSVNGLTAIAADTDRIRVPVQFCHARRALPNGRLLLASVILDTAGTLTIDSPLVDNTGIGLDANSLNGQSIFVVGAAGVIPSGVTVILKSKVGSATATDIASFGPSLAPIPVNSESFICATQPDGVLQATVAGISANQVNIQIYYIIADELVL